MLRLIDLPLMDSILYSIWPDSDDKNAFEYDGKYYKQGQRLDSAVSPLSQLVEKVGFSFTPGTHNASVWLSNRQRTLESFYFEIVDPKVPPLYGLLFDAQKEHEEEGEKRTIIFFVKGKLTYPWGRAYYSEPTQLDYNYSLTALERTLILKVELGTLLSIGYRFDNASDCDIFWRNVPGFCKGEECNTNEFVSYCSAALSADETPKKVKPGPFRRLVPDSAVTAVECVDYLLDEDDRKPDDYRRLNNYKFSAETRQYFIEDEKKFSDLCEFGGLGVAQSLDAIRKKRVSWVLDLFHPEDHGLEKLVAACSFLLPDLPPSLLKFTDGDNKSGNDGIWLQYQYNDHKSIFPLTLEEAIEELEKSPRGFAWKQIPFSIFSITRLILLEVSFFELPVEGLSDIMYILFFLIGPAVIVWLVQGLLLMSIWLELPKYHDVGYFTCNQLPSLQLAVIAVFLITLMHTVLDLFHEFCAIIWTRRAFRSSSLFASLSSKYESSFDDQLEIAILPFHWNTRLVALFIWAMEASILVFTGVVGTLYILTQVGASNTVQAAVAIAFINDIDNQYALFSYPESYGQQRVELPLSGFSVSQKGKVSKRFLFFFIPCMVIATMAIVYGIRLNYSCHNM